jgi:translation initiation factor 1
VKRQPLSGKPGARKNPVNPVNLVSPAKPGVPGAPDSGGLVYSTEAGRMCPACRQPLNACQCAALAATARAADLAKGDGIVRVGRETGGRGGKLVTVVRGLPLADEALATLGKQLRTACGTGGTVKDGVLELQGEHRDRVVALLTAQSYRVKRVGG